MLALCAWCLKEGKDVDAALIGERPPLADTRVTHGICDAHRQNIEERVRRLKQDAERAREDAARAVKEAEQRRDDAEDLERLVDP